MCVQFKDTVGPEAVILSYLKEPIVKRSLPRMDRVGQGVQEGPNAWWGHQGGLCRGGEMRSRRRRQELQGGMFSTPLEAVLGGVVRSEQACPPGW